MKLERFDIDCFNNGDWIEQERRYEDNGDYVEWTPELQESWDKQQPMKINKTKGGEWCPRCGANVDEEHQYSNDYCACCGQNLAQD